MNETLDPRQNPNSILYAPPITQPQPGDFRYAEPLTPEKMQEARDNLARQEAEFRAKRAAIDAAFQSTEAKKIRELIQADGNVEWRDFMSHVGGILEVVKLVDANGVPDPDRIVPLVDELFYKQQQPSIDAGSVFRHKPGNRPFKPNPEMQESRRVLNLEALGEGSQEVKDIEAALAEQNKPPRPRTTHAR